MTSCLHLWRLVALSLVLVPLLVLVLVLVPLVVVPVVLGLRVGMPGYGLSVSLQGVRLPQSGLRERR